MPQQRIIGIAIAGVGLAVGLATMTGVAGAGADGGALGATARIVDTSGNEIGFAKFTEDANGAVHVNIKVAGLTVGKHGVHIHDTGACTLGTGFSGAGPHYNPGGGSHDNHAGDLPNMIVNEGLRGRLNATTTRVTLSDGPTTVFDSTTNKVGSAIVIHAKEDDLGLGDAPGSQENGNSGVRVACGVIVEN